MPKGTKKADTCPPERQILEEWIRPEPEKPYYMAIRNAFIQRFVNWYLSPPGEESPERDWYMLASLLFRLPPTNPNRDWRKLPSPPRIIRVLRHSLRVIADYRRKGKPIGDKLRVAALALDLQSSDPERWSWRALTDHLCNCGLREHIPGSNCQKNLRREAVWLKKWLQNQGINVPQ